MNLKVSFSWIGLVIFALPMLINIAYVMFPAAFLILYYAVWFRYFMGGREISLLSCSFFFALMPLAA